MTRWLRVAQLRTAAEFRARLAVLGVELPFDESVASDGPLSQPFEIGGRRVGNRFAILPMEGWDATAEGGPSELTLRRWQRFGESGAKLIWGGEAVAVRPDGRANPHQLLIGEATLPGLARLRESLVRAHAERFGRSDDLLVGLQLTHAGRFARPRPLIAYHHPLLDRRLGIPADLPILGDDALAKLAEDFVAASVIAERAGFRFVDLKHCHGYLGHELLSAFERPGRYGGSFENRTRFLREMVTGVRAEAPGLAIGVRFSAFDFIPYQAGLGGVGEPETTDGRRYRHAFGGDGTGLGIDLAEPRRLLDLLLALDVRLVCVSAGSPYYNPHIQRPALFPPSDGYEPPEDPLAGVARQIAVTASLKRHRPELAVVGSAYSYLQEWLPHVAQAVVRTGQADFVGIGRGALTYPDMVADVLAGRALDRKRICRTFSDCTSAPRRGWVSGCYPLDPLFKERRPEAAELAARRKAIASRGRT
jgi:2,4-dienoyl-CoA reductase-like NADH-dependent reductase (Old Yellow Enzyme family)